MKSSVTPIIMTMAMALMLLIPDHVHAADPYTHRCAPDLAFVTSLYHSILKRSPDNEGQRNWVTFLAKGMKREEVIRRFFESPEYRGFGRNNRDYARDLYFGILGREPDSEGLGNWTRSLGAGMSRSEVMRRFFESAEYRGIVEGCGSSSAGESRYVQNCADDEEFVSSLYHAILNREPDNEGHRNWVRSIREGMRRDEVIARFFKSPEYTGFGRSIDDYVRDLYHGVLGREPDRKGFSDWTRTLQGGKGREQVLQSFIGSEEYRNISKKCR